LVRYDCGGLYSANERNYFNKDGRVQEISQITQGLKAIAKELGVPVVALSQLSRQVEQRDDHKPQLADLENLVQLNKMQML
jgi:replicative DNA helicase